VFSAIDDGAEAVAVIKWNCDAGDDGARLLDLRAAVQRQVHCDLVAESGDGAGQSPDYIGQSSGFRVWNTLGCSEQHVHGASAEARINIWMRAA